MWWFGWEFVSSAALMALLVVWIVWYRRRHTTMKLSTGGKKLDEMVREGRKLPARLVMDSKPAKPLGLSPASKRLEKMVEESRPEAGDEDDYFDVLGDSADKKE